LELTYGDEKMPVISFDIVELEKEQKEILAKEFSESASRVTGLPVDMFYVLFNERKADNVGVGGVLLSNQEF
jgi:4-oxalocrotonate tautomerase